MPKKNETKETKKETVEFLEFEDVFKESENDFIKLSGRIYPTKDAGKKIERNFVSLKVNDLLSISCEFIETSNNYFVAMPQYKSGDKYKSWVYIEKGSPLSSALEKLSEELLSLKQKF